MMNYGEILAKAWKTIWKHKILWLFGVLAGCAANVTGGVGGSAAGGGGANVNIQPANLSFLNPLAQKSLEDIGQFLVSIPPWVWVLLVVVLIVMAFVFSLASLLVGSLGQAGVIKGTGMADDADPEDTPLSLRAIFNQLKPHYWNVLLLNVGFRLAGFVLALLLALPMILLVLGTCCLGLFLLIPLGWFIDVMLNFTTIAIVEEGLGIFDAIKRAWQVITGNLVHVLIMFLILGVGGSIVGLIIGLPMLIIPVPLVTNLVITGAQSITIGLIMSVLLSIVFVPMLVFLTGVLRAFILSSWTLTFRQLALEGDLAPTVLNDRPDAE
jgi:hypothetical protein